MKTTLRKLSALLLVPVMLFSLGSVPASAVNIYEEDRYYGYVEVYDYGNEEDKNFFEKIKDTFHWYIARLFFRFEADCPICGEHFAPPVIDSHDKIYNNAVNALKEYTGIVTINKVTTINAATRDVPNVVAAIINPVLENLTGTTKNTYTFISGKTADGRTITDTVAPIGREASLSYDGIYGAHSKINAETNIPVNLSIQLVSETEVFDGISTVNTAVYNNSVADTINLAALDLGPIKIHQAEATYPSTEIFASFDDLGRITSLRIVKPADIYATGKAGIQVTLTVNANITEEYTITYVS